MRELALGQTALQFDVSELVDGAHLPQNAPVFVGVLEKGRQVTRQAVAAGEAAQGQSERAPGGTGVGGGQAECRADERPTVKPSEKP